MKIHSIFIIIFLFSLVKTAEEIEGKIRIDGKRNWIVEIGSFSDEFSYISTAFYTPGLSENG